MTLEKDTLLKGRYKILEILGEGGMGAVYKAYDNTLGVVVAVKENLFSGEEYVRQFRVEATILASLRHPHLTRVTDHFEEGEVQYLVMDYIDGEDLRDRMDRLGTLNEEEVILIGVAICDALTYLHSRIPSILHRDVKPGNVKIAPDGQIYLVDFGLAKVVQGQQITITGARAMTPGYSPPEQYGTARTDARTDVYSLGATLYSTLTAALPEDGLARAMKQAELTPVRRHNPQVSRKLANVIEKALAVQPDDRYQTAEEFKQALGRARGITRRPLEEEEITVPPAPPQPDNNDREAAASDSQPVSLRARVEAGRAPDLEFDREEISRPAQPSPVRSSGNNIRKSRRSGCWLAVAALIIILGGGAAFSYFVFPDTTEQAIAYFIAAPNTVTPASEAGSTMAPVATETPAASASSTQESPTPAPSATATISPTPSVTTRPSLTPSPTSTMTSVPTDTPLPGPTPLGGGSQIAYASDQTSSPQIWIMNVDGSGKRQLTDLNGGACQPDWSPDGSQLVFTSPCPGEQEEYPNSRLYIINADGTNLTPLPAEPGGDFDPNWSPDGNRIAFTTLRGGNSEIYVLNLRTMSAQPVVEGGFRNFHPAWNWLGNKIAFVGARPGPFRIWITDQLGEEPVPFSRSGSLKNTSPIWSPDDTHVVFTQRELPDGIPRLMIVAVADDGFFEVNLVDSTIPRRQGDFSPDGHWITYESWPDGTNHDIFILELDGEGELKLTDASAFDFDPAWKPLP